MWTVATYEIGPPLRPRIEHDNGFLGGLPQRPPTMADRIKFAGWTAILEAAEAAQKVPFIPHNDLPDALAAYRHFLYGKGANSTFSYERYVADDASGRTTLNSAILDMRRGVEDLARSRLAGASPSFQFRSSPIQCGELKQPKVLALFPYPATENWAKAIGGHVIWLSGLATLTGTKPEQSYTVMLTLNAEDRYNFNPGDEDIETGIPDDANGVFEVTGLAQQYTSYSTLTRVLRWASVTDYSTTASRLDPQRERSPSSNRRARNRI